MSTIAKFFRQTGGTSAIEFAFTAPVYMALVFAVIEIGFVLWTQFGLEHGVEEGARCASVNTTTCSNASATANYAAANSLGITVPASVFTVSSTDCGNMVRASYTYSYFTSYLGVPNVTLTAQSCYPSSGLSGAH